MASRIISFGLVGAIASVAAVPHNAKATTETVTVSPGQVFQDFDGIGISEAFGHAAVLHGDSGLSANHSTEILDFLFSDKGAALTILRNDITEAIEPNPGNFTWDGYDDGQLWLSQQAYSRGLRKFYADAWSAPHYMKTNNNTNNGGYLCGVTGTDCATGDWRKAYANYLVQYLKDYASAGITYDYIGFLNEPEENVTYSSMLSDGQQAADFIEVFSPILKRSGFKTQIACCDNDGWENTRNMIGQLQNATGAASGAYNDLGLVTSHGYSSPPTTPLPTKGKKVWETEWADLSTMGQRPWYNNSGSAEALTWANNIQHAFTVSNVSAFLGWVGTTGSFASNDALIEVVGDDYLVSPRLWAFAQYSRFVRPGAKRVGATSTNSTLAVSAFVNADKSTAVQVINNSDTDKTVVVEGVSKGAYVQTYLSNNANNLTAVHANNAQAGYQAKVPARSMVSFVIPAKR